MPPKVPNLKFKPRHVVRPKEEPDVPESPMALDNLSLVQLERLRLQQEAALQQEQREQKQQHCGQLPPPEGALLSTSTGSVSNAGAVTSTSDERPRGIGRVTAAAANIRALTRDPSNIVPTSERLPENTMYNILEMESSNPATTVYHPIPLDSSLSAPLKRGSAEFAVEEGGEEPAVDNDGTAFLKGYEREIKSSRRDNLRFEREFLRASVNTAETDAEAGRCHAGELVWFQLPRFQTGPPFQLSNLPPGKVGEMKVYRSGRMVMEIGGVCYDVAAQGCSPGGGEPCNVVCAVTPAQQPTDMARCYQMGLLEKKLVCTPNIHVDAS